MCNHMRTSNMSHAKEMITCVSFPALHSLQQLEAPVYATLLILRDLHHNYLSIDYRLRGYMQLQ